jgi:N4-(beta-N-acetylglucosaminyl)-L-asparaginase
MFKRRDFLKAAAWSPFIGAATMDALNKNFARRAVPVAIATWGPNQRSTQAAWDILNDGGYALDAVEAGARIPEGNPKDSSVGYGGMPDRDGHVTLDACIMNEKGGAGSVCFIEEIMHPISVARRVMEKTPHVMLAGEGAQRFAVSEGFAREDLLTENAKKSLEQWLETSDYSPEINVERHDTIGILALDLQHRMCGACTTSGLAYKMRGRVGDSPIIGAGLYVDGEVGAAACTGLGELAMKTLASFMVVEEMHRGASPLKAAERAIKRIVRKFPKETEHAQIGLIALDVKGHHGAFGIHKGFNYALANKNGNNVFEAGYLK